MSEVKKWRDIDEEDKKILRELKMTLESDDHRYISDELLNEFTNGKFSEFNKFIKNKTDLVVCFRGNGNTECIDIYYNNHRFWKLSVIKGKCRVTINYDHARYYNEKGDCMEPMDELVKLGFEREKIKVVKKNRNGKVCIEVGVGDLICENREFDEAFVKGSYLILKPIIHSFFSLKDEFQIDQFKLQKGINSQRRKDPCIEKRWQQRLFQHYKNVEDGLFVYDLEFSQKFPNKNVRKQFNDKIARVNEPDMLAIRFDKGKPKALVLVEVKSTESACTGKSDIKKHLEGMMKYSEYKFIDENDNEISFMKTRKEDAKRILEQYQQPGLFDELKGINFKDIDFEKLDTECLLILTDNELEDENETKNYKYKGKSAKRYYAQNKDEINVIADAQKCEIWCMEGHYTDGNIKHIPQFSPIHR